MPKRIPRNDEISVRALVKGSVQGVGFRATTRNQAVRLGIVGTVRNLADGSVEIYASGSRFAVDALMKTLREGSGAGRVAAIYIEDLDSVKSYDDFTVLF